MLPQVSTIGGGLALILESPDCVVLISGARDSVEVTVSEEGSDPVENAVAEVPEVVCPHEGLWASVRTVGPFVADMAWAGIKADGAIGRIRRRPTVGGVVEDGGVTE